DARLAETFLDSTLAVTSLDHYVPVGPPPFTVAWSGSLVAPRTGAYRLSVVSDGAVTVDLDGKPLNLPTAKPESWQPTANGSPIQLSAGPHPIRVTLLMANGGRSIARLSWVPPRGDGQVDVQGDWSVVPPSALRPATPLWDVTPAG